MGVYHIKSLKWTNHKETNPMGEDIWWGPDNSGYTKYIEEAGIYTEDQIKKHKRCHSSDSTEVIPIEVELWDDKRIRAWNWYLEADENGIEKWERNLCEARNAVDSAKSMIKHHEKSAAKLKMELAIQEKLRNG